MDCTNQLIDICNKIVNALIDKDYDKLQNCNAFARVAQNDLIRVLNEYGGVLTPIPPTAYATNAFQIYTYSDGSGYHVDLDLWIDEGRSDLTLQIDVQITPHTQKIIYYQINDLLIM